MTHALSSWPPLGLVASCRNASCMKTNGQLLATLRIVLMAAAAGLGPAASAGSQPDSVPISNSSRFDHFVYLRHNEVNGVALTDSLMLVALTANGFEVRPAYSESNLHIAWTPLCVRGGRLYAVKLHKLVAIDLATGKFEQMETYIESFTFEEGWLYGMVHQPGADVWGLRIYDFDTRSFRDIAAINPVRTLMSGYNPAPAPYPSPDKKWLAYFSPSRSNSFFLRWQLQLVSLQSGAARACGDFLQAREFGTGAGFVAVGPAFTWVTSKTILVVRDESKQLTSEMGVNPRAGGSGFGTLDGSSVEMRLAALDIDSGRMTNLMRLPAFQPGIAEPNFRPADERGAPRIVLGKLGQYRVDLSTGKVIEDDGLRGPYFYRSSAGSSELLLGITRLDSGNAMPQVSVSPDGQCIAWETKGPQNLFGSAPRSAIRFHTAPANTPRMVATEWIPQVYADGYRRSLEGNLLWFSSSDLASGQAEQPAPGWSPFTPPK
jgi:hypothetical protein